MSFYDTVECPYCRCEHDMDTYDFDGGNDVDIECENCGREFEVIREWNPTYTSNRIEYTNCESCNRELRVGHNVYTFEHKELCQTCHGRQYVEWLNQSK